MTVWFVSRHAGAIAWAQQQGLVVDQLLSHLNPAQVQAADTVIGTLPVNLAAEICARGARYLHLSLRLPPELRGQELTAEQLTALGACLQPYVVQATDT